MDVHFDDGTHRFELPVSRTTLNVWGGVPIPISAKSRILVSVYRGGSTLSVEEVCQRKTMTCLTVVIESDLNILVI